MIASMFADVMDITSLTRWRATCRDNYDHAVASIRRSLTSRIHPFVPYPHKLVNIVAKHGAVFSGEVALSFLLWHETYQATTLEIFTSNFQFESLCADIIDDPEICTHIERQSFLQCSVTATLRRHIAETLVIHMANNMPMYIHRSYTCSPSDPVTCSTCTALSNFVTNRGFGCSHPTLTLSRQALVADLDLPDILPHDALILNHLLTHKSSLAVSPTVWPEYRRQMDGETLRTPEECWRQQFVCLKQGRYFGDRGSLVGFFDPLGGDEEQCMENNVAPFGPMVIWRIMSTFDCEDGCEYMDEVLEQSVTSVPVLFKKDPFGELRDCVADRCMRSSPFYRTFGRPRSLSF